MRAIPDRPVFITGDAHGDVEAISVVSLTELHFGVLLAIHDDQRARCTDWLAAVEATFDPLPVTPEIARAWGRLAATMRQRGGQPRRRQIALAISATAAVAGVPFLIHNLADSRISSIWWMLACRRALP